MPEDKRITKTKKNLKQTMITLLNEKPFDKISVSELCKTGDTSRITFYTYYEDKFALIEDMMNDYYAESDARYHKLQDINNPSRDGVKSYENLLEGILEMFAANYDFFKHVAPNINPYLNTSFYKKINVSLADYIERHTETIHARYPARQTAALLCGGLAAVIYENNAAVEKTWDSVQIIRDMYSSLLNSTLFVRGSIESGTADTER